MKLTRKQIEAIRSHTPEELKGKQVRIAETLGTYQKSGTNWSYIVGWTAEGYLVVTRFGEVM